MGAWKDLCYTWKVMWYFNNKPRCVSAVIPLPFIDVHPREGPALVKVTVLTAGTQYQELVLIKVSWYLQCKQEGAHRMDIKGHQHELQKPRVCMSWSQGVSGDRLSLPQEGGFKTSIFICRKCARFHNDNQVRNVLGSQGERILMYYKNNTNSRWNIVPFLTIRMLGREKLIWSKNLS